MKLKSWPAKRIYDATHKALFSLPKGFWLQIPVVWAEMSPNQSGFDSMAKASYRVPWYCNAGAAFSSWIQLAGFIMLPGTFTSFQNFHSNAEAIVAVQSFAKRTGILCLSIACWSAGVVGIILLWLKYRRDHLYYLWLLDRLFL